MLNAISYGIDADRRCLPDLFPFRLWIAAGGCSFVRGSYRGAPVAANGLDLCSSASFAGNTDLYGYRFC